MSRPWRWLTWKHDAPCILTSGVMSSQSCRMRIVIHPETSGCKWELSCFNHPWKIKQTATEIFLKKLKHVFCIDLRVQELIFPFNFTFPSPVISHIICHFQQIMPSLDVCFISLFVSARFTEYVQFRVAS